jgi:catechol 2,3-dioxygenase-like lactoylglutathione lyase family enzyme
MRVLGIDHATIKTPLMAETRAFFEQVLGLTAGPAPAFDHPVCWLYAEGRDVVHIVGAERSQAPSQSASINHFALRIGDYEGAVAELRRSGVAFETDTTPGGELRQIYVTDPNGVRVELNCPGEGHAT